MLNCKLSAFHSICWVLNAYKCIHARGEGQLNTMLQLDSVSVSVIFLMRQVTVKASILQRYWYFTNIIYLSDLNQKEIIKKKRSNAIYV